MTIRVLAAAVISAVLMFMWGFVYWAVLGGGAKTQSPLPADSELDLLAVMRNAEMPSGMYVYPFPAEMGDEEATAEFNAKHEEGPILQMAYRAEGGPPMEPAVMALGFAHMGAVALLASVLTAMAAGGLPTFGRRFAFVLLVAVTGTVWADLGDAIWWFHPLRYAAGNMIYQVVAGALMAVVIAALVRRRADEMVA